MSDNDLKYIDEQLAYLERSIQVILGVTISIIAGFLSQVWSSAKPEFKLDLALSLEWIGFLFFMTIFITIFRALITILKETSSRSDYGESSERIRVAWLFFLFLIFSGYLTASQSIAQSIVRYAVMPENAATESKAVESAVDWWKGSWPSAWLRCTDSQRCP